jgi:RNA polymerase sigma-70 factor (ECF subfamily)
MSAEDPLQILVRRCQRDDAMAFEELFRRFQPRLRYYVRRLDAGGDHTDDTLQEVWTKVVRGIASLRDGKAFVAWLYAIARNEVYGRAKGKGPFVELTEEHLESLSEDPEPVFQEEDAARIHQALAALRPAQREILTLCFLEELSHEEIARILGLPAGTVKSRLYYAKQALRKELERDYGSP